MNYISIKSKTMNIEDLISRIEEEFDDLKPGLLKPEIEFQKVIDFNSVNALILIALVDAEYDVTINAKDLKPNLKVQELYEIIKSRM